MKTVDVDKIQLSQIGKRLKMLLNIVDIAFDIYGKALRAAALCAVNSAIMRRIDACKMKRSGEFVERFDFDFCRLFGIVEQFDPNSRFFVKSSDGGNNGGFKFFYGGAGDCVHIRKVVFIVTAFADQNVVLVISYIVNGENQIDRLATGTKELPLSTRGAEDFTRDLFEHHGFDLGREHCVKLVGFAVENGVTNIGGVKGKAAGFFGVDHGYVQCDAFCGQYVKDVLFVTCAEMGDVVSLAHAANIFDPFLKCFAVFNRDNDGVVDTFGL